MTLPDRSQNTTSATASHSSALGFRALQLLAVALLIAPVIYWQGGVLLPETTWFITHYLDDRGLVQKVFDPDVNDFEAYQGRELSYFFDYLDAQVFRELLGRGFVLFVAASSLLASAALVLVHQCFTRRLLPKLDRVTSILVLLLFLSGFVHISTDGVLYRSAKPLLAPLVLLSMTLVWYFHQPRQGKPWTRIHGMVAFLSLFVLGSAMCLLDRIGFFFVTLAAGLAYLHCMLQRGRWSVFLGLAAASGFGVFYNRVLGPALIHRVNGYWPKFEYQQLEASRLATEPMHLARGCFLMLEQIWLFFGNYALLIGIVAACVCLASWFRRDRTAQPAVRPASLLPVLYALLAFAALSLMFALMHIRHPAIYAVDHRLSYFGVPIQAALIFPTMLCLGWFLEGASSRRVLAVNAILLILVVSNLASWDRYYRQVLTAEWGPFAYRQTAALRRSLEQGTPEAELRAPYAAFYRDCVQYSSAEGVEEPSAPSIETSGTSETSVPTSRDGS